jgi:SAM-dependent methyltransferase
MEVHRVYGALLRGVRRRRMHRFARTFGPDEPSRVLDVGGSRFNWELSSLRSPVVLLNVDRPRNAAALPARFALVTGSGTDLPCRDASFDVVFSNSVIEHVGDPASQRRFAQELRRVGRRLWVQTPARWFPFEPHLLTPFAHYLPKRWQRRLLRRFTVWGWLARPSPEQVERFLRETRLLTYREMRALFPDCEIRRERVLFLTKSYVAVRS